MPQHTITVHSKTRLPNLTEADVGQLLSSCNDADGHHILYVTQDGHVHVTNDLRGTPSDWDDPDVRFRYETYIRGNDYVGPKAANDKAYVKNLAKELLSDWNSGKTGFVDY